MFHMNTLSSDDLQEIPSLDEETEFENVCCKYLAVLYNISTISSILFFDMFLNFGMIFSLSLTFFSEFTV